MIRKIIALLTLTVALIGCDGPITPTPTDTPEPAVTHTPTPDAYPAATDTPDPYEGE